MTDEDPTQATYDDTIGRFPSLIRTGCASWR